MDAATVAILDDPCRRLVRRRAAARRLWRWRQDSREPRHDQRPAGRLQRPGTRYGGRAGIQDQCLGQPQGDQSLRPVPRGRRPGAAVRPAGRHQSRVCRGQRRGQPRVAARFAHGAEGGRWSQLLARECRGVRRHPDDVDPELGGRRVRRRREGHHAQGAGDQGPGRQQELPVLTRAVRVHGVPGGAGNTVRAAIPPPPPLHSPRSSRRATSTRRTRRPGSRSTSTSRTSRGWC